MDHDDFCLRSPNAALLQAVREFNTGLYFECHETLEDLWLDEEDPLRRFYQGILQIGVAFLHLRRGNQPGAVKLCRSGLDYLQPFTPYCQHVDVAKLVAETTIILQRLEDLGPEGLTDLQQMSMPRIEMVADMSPQS